MAYLVNHLIEKGFTVNITDPQASERNFQMEMEFQGYFLRGRDNYQYFGSNHLKAAAGASAIVVGTEWDEYQTLDYEDIRKIMKPDQALFFDLRSYLNVEKIQKAGFDKVFKLGN